MNIFLYFFSTVFLCITSKSFAESNDYGRLNASSCAGIDNTTTTCVAVGYQLIEGKTYPLIVQSTNGGQTYTKVTNVTDLPYTAGTLLSVDCKNEDEESRCVAVGYLGPDKEHSEFLILRKQQGSTQWVRQTNPDFTMGLLTKVSCYGFGTEMGCYAVGYDPHGSRSGLQKPLLLESAAGVENWHTLDIANMPNTGKLTKLNCRNVYRNIACAAVGYNLDQKKPFIIDNLSTEWKIRTIFNEDFFKETSVLEDVSCSINLNEKFCLAIGHSGYNKANYTSIYVNMINDLASGSNITIPHSANGLTTTVCLPEQRCIAGGGTISGGLLETYSRVDNWQIISASMMQGVSFNHVTCTDDGSLCVAIGEKATKAFLGYSKDKGFHWTFSNIMDTTKHGMLRGSSCSFTNNQNSICLAVGYSQGDYDHRGQPLLVQTNNSGLEWKVVNYN